MTDDATREEGSRKGGATSADEILLRILNGQAAHGRMLHSILELLTASRDRDGPSLSALLEVLIKRIGDQTSALQALTLAVATLGRELPADLVAAIEDNLGFTEREGTGLPSRSAPS